MVKNLSKDDILSSAIRYFNLHSDQEPSARNLAKFSGFSTQPLYRFYPSMEKLWQDVVEHEIKQFKDGFCKKSKPRTLTELDAAYLSFSNQNPGIAKNLVNNWAYSDLLIKQLNRIAISCIEQPDFSHLNKEQKYYLIRYNWLLVSELFFLTNSGVFDMSQDELKAIIATHVKNMEKFIKK